jgi:hypothetical protein
MEFIKEDPRMSLATAAALNTKEIAAIKGETESSTNHNNTQVLRQSKVEVEFAQESFAPKM